MRSLTVAVKGRPPTPNSRRHWRVIARDNATWKEAARLTAIDAMNRDEADWSEPIRYAAEYVMVFVVPTNAERDWDNAVASGKPITDGLVAAGVLAGDSTRVIAPEGRRVVFAYQAGLSMVVIKVVEGPAVGTLDLFRAE